MDSGFTSAHMPNYHLNFKNRVPVLISFVMCSVNHKCILFFDKYVMVAFQLTIRFTGQKK